MFTETITFFKRVQTKLINIALNCTGNESRELGNMPYAVLQFNWDERSHGR